MFVGTLLGISTISIKGDSGIIHYKAVYVELELQSVEQEASGIRVPFLHGF